MPIFIAKICIIVEVPIPYYSVLYGMRISQWTCVCVIVHLYVTEIRWDVDYRIQSCQIQFLPTYRSSSTLAISHVRKIECLCVKIYRWSFDVGIEKCSCMVYQACPGPVGLILKYLVLQYEVQKILCFCDQVMMSLTDTKIHRY